MKALGMIEVYGMVPAVEALDAALKAADVHVTEVKPVKGGLVTVMINGDVGAVKAAVDAAQSAAARTGTVNAVHVIARPAGGLEKILGAETTSVPEPVQDNPPADSLQQPAKAQPADALQATEGQQSPEEKPVKNKTVRTKPAQAKEQE
ncbi:BMC domain-containing protein [Ruminococcus sp. OA3]|uniref:BMC domain-containing protein n=1 Tax=Ruminococcus sp. OA3 TaxID=2914164 RepID=UPI0023DD45BF|nr:BMC domain-containing protein [Ruminococcus sp. OA3]